MNPTPDEHIAAPDSTAVRHVSAAALGERYVAGRPDGLRPPGNAEELLVATTGRRESTKPPTLRDDR